MPYHGIVIAGNPTQILGEVYRAADAYPFLGYLMLQPNLRSYEYKVVLLNGLPSHFAAATGGGAKKDAKAFLRNESEDILKFAEEALETLTSSTALSLF